MKKVFSLILALGLIASLTACGGGNASGNETGDSAPAASTAKLRFVTGGESGTYYAFGSVIAQHATNNAASRGAPESPSTQQIPLQCDRSHKNWRSRTSRLTRVLSI